MINPQSCPNARISSDARPALRITFDSRQVDSQTAFAALPGQQMHGNLFIAAALEKGAPFILCEDHLSDVPRAVQVADTVASLRAWARQKRDGHTWPVVGVTGSAGKTTAKTYIAAALEATATPGNLNTLNAIACFLLEHAQDTDSPLVVEMGIDRIGEMQELMQLVHPNFGVVTAVGEAHLEFLGTVANVAREKGGVLAASQLGLVHQNTAHFYSGVATYGFEGATFAASQLVLSSDSAKFNYHGQEVRLPVGSAAVASAVVAALAIAEQCRIPLPEAVQRIAHTEVPGGRYRVHKVQQYTFIDDSYNANPISMRAALQSLAQYSGRKIAVLGDMRELGPDSQQYHQDIAQLAAQSADLVFSTGDMREHLSSNAFAEIPDLVAALKNTLQAGDTVLFKASRGVALERALEGLMLSL